MSRKYNLGLDISITGIGWCVTDTDGRILRKGNHHLFGTSLFAEAKTAKERRLKRGARRNNDRKKRRIDALQQLMAPDVLPEDDSFYFRLDETAYQAEDRHYEHLYRTLPEFLFTDGTVRVRDSRGGKQNLPIYEIRSELIRQKKKADIRYVYLALAHILKSRGHFMEETLISGIRSRDDAARYLTGVIGQLNELHGICIPDDYPTVEQFCLSLETERDAGELKNLAVSLFSADDESVPVLKNLAAALAGEEIRLGDLIPDAKGKASLSGIEDLSVFDNLDDGTTELLQTLSEIHAWRDAAQKDRGEQEYLSFEMNRRYEQHREDLALLKRWIRKYAEPGIYRKFFHDDREEVSYNAYTHSRTNPSAYEGENWHWCSQESLYGKIREIILACPDPDGTAAGEEIIRRMYDENGSVRPNGFLPLQRIRHNAEIPNRMQMRDLLAILDNQAEYYSTLRLNRAKIADLCGFIIPSYVGPLRQGRYSPFRPWIQYRTQGKDPVMPWNFAERVNLEATAEAYIEGLTSHCTFLPGEKVLPRRSLLYEEYMVLDELNRIRVQFTEEREKNGRKEWVTCRELILVKEKKRIVEELFAKYRHVTGDMILRWLKTNSGYAGKEDLAVISANGTEKKRFTASLASRIALEKIFGRKITDEDPLYADLEKVILWSTVFRDRDMYRRRLHKVLDGRIEPEALRKLESFRCTGWGKFSRKLLTAEVCRFREEKKSIIYVMRETSDNFMRIYHNRKYKTRQGLKKLLPREEPGKITYDMILRMPCSPAMKRGLWHAVRVIEEIRGYMGCDPAGIYIRNMRDTNARRRSVLSSNRTRFEQVRRLYDAYEAETGEKIDPKLRSLLQKTRNAMTDDQYLYLTQLGRCMYTGKPIDLSAPGTYMTDYVVPLSLMADESLDNRVLIRTEANQRESKQAMPKEVIRTMNSFWARLNTYGFITGSKRKKLTTAVYDETELHVYLNSQWKETSLTILRLTDMLKRHYPESHVYGINARLTDQLRKQGSLYSIRELNDCQTAYEAFLTAHIGGFADRYLPKVTSENSYNRILLRLWERTGKSDKNGIILGLYDQDQPDEELPGGAWKGAEERRNYLEKVYSWHDGYTSFLPTENRGKFYDETRYRPGTGAEIPLKGNMDAETYGGHERAATGHMAVIAYEKGGKTFKELVNIPVFAAARKDLSFRMFCLQKLQGFNPEAGYLNLRILKDDIGLNQEILYKGHPFYMSSASEAVNAKQLHVPRRHIRAIWQSVTIPADDLEAMVEKNEFPAESFRDAAVFLTGKLLKEYDIYPKLIKSVKESTEKIPGLRVSDQARLIHALIMCMNTRGIRIAPVIRTMSDRLLQGDTRMSNRRIYGDEIVLVNRSVTGIYTKVTRV